MEDIYIDIRKENDVIKKQFLTCDVISVARLLERIEELVEEKEQIKEQYRLQEPDEFDLWRERNW